MPLFDSKQNCYDCGQGEDWKRIKQGKNVQSRKFATIDEYIGSFPPNVQKILEQLRNTIAKLHRKRKNGSVTESRLFHWMGTWFILQVSRITSASTLPRPA